MIKFSHKKNPLFNLFFGRKGDQTASAFRCFLPKPVASEAHSEVIVG